MCKADARTRSSLLVKHFAATAMGGAPLLTEIEAFELQQSFKSEEERDECATALKALISLYDCIEDARVKQLKVANMITFLGTFFHRAMQFRGFENFLNELCLKSDGEYSTRLQRRIVATGKLMPYFCNIGLNTESDNREGITFNVTDGELALTNKVNEMVEQQMSKFKALTKVTRDLMQRYTTPIDSVTDLIDDLENSVREAIFNTKRLLFDTSVDRWEWIKEILEERSDPLLAMKEALPDYDDIVFDEDLYEERMRSVNQEIAEMSILS